MLVDQTHERRPDVAAPEQPDPNNVVSLTHSLLGSSPICRS
jgi:hypothetical protein